MTETAIKPNKRAFILTRILASLLGSVLVAAVLLVLSVMFSWWISLGLILVLIGSSYDLADAFVSYRKQAYRLADGKVYFDEGHLFSDRKTELRFENITTVRVIKPFFEYNIFGTGNIKIEAAGSKSAAVTFRSIDNPYQLFEDIKQLLGQQTFSLTYDELLSVKKPSPLAVILQMGSGFFVLLFIVLSNIGVVTAVSSFIYDLPMIVPAIIGVAIAAAAGVFLLVIYRDQARRTYSVYNDVIHYSKGYLTKQEAFIPAANLANTELTQNFIGKLLNLQDVVVSCQGQGGKINFANLRHGADMQKSINLLINNRKQLFKSKAQSESTQASAPAEVSQSVESVSSRLLAAPTPQVDDVSAEDFQMDIKRAIFAAWPTLIFPPAFIIAAVQAYIIAKRTVYRLTDGGVASYYSFLSTKHVELSRDKITGLIVRRNPLDRWLGTCSVEFWSIGSGTVLTMSNIAYSPELIDTMKAKAGIPDDEELELTKPQFNLVNLVLANLWSVVMFSLLILISLGLAIWLSGWFYLALAAIIIGLLITIIILGRRYKRTELRLGRYTTELQVGVLFRKKYWVLNKNIKRVSLSKYPLTDLGSVTFNVAGEHPVADGNANKTTLVPNRFKAPYIGKVGDELVSRTAKYDAILSTNPTKSRYKKLITDYPQSELKAKSRPSLRNTLLVIIPLHVIILPLIVILPLSILISWYWIRRVSYLCTSDRIIKRWGVIYRQQTSIIFNKLDYTEQGQAVINKLAKNGNVYLYTAGSSDVELTLDNMSDYKQFHQLVVENHN